MKLPGTYAAYAVSMTFAGRLSDLYGRRVVYLVCLVVFIIGSILAGVGGVIAAPLWSVRPTMGTAILMPAMIIVVLGGIGSFWGSVLAGLIVGLSTSISVMFWARISDIIPFVILIIVLLFRPRGLMGEKSVLEV